MADTTTPSTTSARSGAGEQSKTDVAYELLKQRLLDHTYVAGYRLVISELVRETGISTIPWREAIRRLEAEGWLEIVRNVGARVATFDAASFENTVEVLARLEGYTTALAAPHMTAADFAAARTINEDAKRALEDFDPARVSELNRDFHFIFYERSGDAHLCKLISNEWHRLAAMGRQAVAGRARSAVKEHDQLLRLAEKKRPFDAIDAFAAQHRRNMLQASNVRVVRG